jgi:hypothetical protein
MKFASENEPGKTDILLYIQMYNIVINIIAISTL